MTTVTTDWQGHIGKLAEVIGQALSAGKTEREISEIVDRVVKERHIPLHAEHQWVVMGLFREGGVTKWGVDIHGLTLPNGATGSICLTF